jgi:glycosyltransferase involved in cell wall biosynthesis
VKILVGSYRFAPDVGGIETASAVLATQFIALGHDVRVVTDTVRDDAKPWPFDIIRQPNSGALLGQLRWCDVFFQNNISLQSAWAAFVSWRPWVITHQTWIAQVNGRRGWREYLKRFLLRFATNVAISQAIADDIGVQCLRIGNPYRSEVFQRLPGSRRDRELVFLGRLVSDKGLDLLIEALAVLRRDHITPRLTVIGTGPEEAAIRELAKTLNVFDQIEFAGLKTGIELTELLNTHRIMVVPSRWAEPFGIVALEGIACGCVIVGSADGGLTEAIGPCGITFPNGSVPGLAEALRTLLQEPLRCEALLAHRDSHLARFDAATVAREYLQLFQSVAR